MTPVKTAGLVTSLLVAGVFGALAASVGQAPVAALAASALAGSLTMAFCAI